MKTLKIKRYRLGVSLNFPTTHPRKGQPTNFDTKIEMMLQGFKGLENTKLHTIRANYPLWEKRIKEVQEGSAVIELFYWNEKPYYSKQVVFAVLDKDSGCGVQELGFYWGGKDISCVIEKPFVKSSDATGIPPIIPISELAKNDGLSLEDFKAWFAGYDLSEPMAIIHFTSFRY